MTNTIAITLFVLIAGAVAYDAYAQDWTMSLFLARKGVQLLEWLAFWR